MSVCYLSGQACGVRPGPDTLRLTSPTASRLGGPCWRAGMISQETTGHGDQEVGVLEAIGQLSMAETKPWSVDA